MPRGKQYFDELIEYWKSLPTGSDPIPAKTNFSPMRHYKMLPYLYFGERLGRYSVRYRLLGDELEEAIRSKITNRNVFDTIPEADRERVADFYDHVFALPCGGMMTRLLRYETGLVYDLESLCLPLADPEGSPRFIVGLAELTKNRKKSVEFYEEAIESDQLVELTFADIGYGLPILPPADKSEDVNHAH